jgi:hypothetical protein
MANLYQNFLNQPEKALQYYEKYVELRGSALPANDPVHTNMRLLKKQIEQAKRKPEEPKRPDASGGNKSEQKAEQKPDASKPGDNKAVPASPAPAADGAKPTPQGARAVSALVLA